MRIAVIADVHGNRDALAAVLEDIDARCVDLAIDLGDYLSGPLDARGAAKLLMERDMLHVRGNHDPQLLERDEDGMGASDRTANEQIGIGARRRLATLPPTLLVAGEVFACHGTPTSDLTYWTETVDADGRVRPAGREQIEHHAAGADHPVLLCGHTHLSRIVRLENGRASAVRATTTPCPCRTPWSPARRTRCTPWSNGEARRGGRRSTRCPTRRPRWSSSPVPAVVPSGPAPW